jgi:hypothetical protein
LTQEFLDPHRITIDLDAAGLDLGDIQQALDQSGEMLPASPNEANAVTAARADGVVPLQQLRVAQDRVQGTAQLVADTNHVAAFRLFARFAASVASLAFCSLATVRLCAAISSQQQPRLPPGLLLGGDAAFLGKREQPGGDAGDRQQYRSCVDPWVDRLLPAARPRDRSPTIASVEGAHASATASE